MDLEKLHEYIQKKWSNICQIEVLQDGDEIYHAEWNNFVQEDCVHIASATKSIISLLIGIAIDHRMIGNVNDRVLSYFPQYSVKRGEKTISDVTIKHLLTMRAPYKGHGEPWTKVCGSDDWTKASLDFLGGKAGISDKFDYKTVCLHILSGILSKATGMKTVDFANEYLFHPLGIVKHENFYTTTAQEHKLFITDKTPRKPVWLSDLHGLATAGYGLCISALDMTKIAQLQVISSQWIDEMLSPRLVEHGFFTGSFYGYLWWIIHPEKKIYAAIGDSGNIIYIDSIKRITVAISSYFQPTVHDRIGFIENVLLPAIQKYPRHLA